MMKIKLLIISIISVSYISCSIKPISERQQYLMGTTATIIIYEGNKNASNTAFKKIKYLDDVLSDYKPYSQITLINKNAGIKPLIVDPDVVRILNESIKVANETQGFFDPTIGSLTIGVYRFGRDIPDVITQGDIDRAKKLVNYKNLEIVNNSVYLKKRGMKLDLGGIGKGYAIDRSVEELKSNGVKSALVSLSGDIRVFGKDIEIKIQSPFDEREIASFNTGKKDLSISTSGNYQRYVEKNGEKIGHLLVPKRGKSGEDFSSITVLMKHSSTFADAYSTSLFVMGREKALKFIDLHDDIGVFFVFNDGTIFINNTFKSLVNDLKLKKNQLF